MNNYVIAKETEGKRIVSFRAYDNEKYSIYKIRIQIEKEKEKNLKEKKYFELISDAETIKILDYVTLLNIKEPPELKLKDRVEELEISLSEIENIIIRTQ